MAAAPDLQTAVVNAAVRRQDHDALRRLYVEDVDMNGIDCVSGLSPLATAARHGLLAELDLLYATGADVGLVCDRATGLTAAFALITSGDCPDAARLPCLRLMDGWGGFDVDALCDGESGLEHVARRTPMGVAPPHDLALLRALILRGATVDDVFVGRGTRAVLLEWTTRQLAAHDAATTVLLAARSGVAGDGTPCVFRELPFGPGAGSAMATIAAFVGLRSTTHRHRLRAARSVWLSALDDERHSAETHLGTRGDHRVGVWKESARAARGANRVRW